MKKSVFVTAVAGSGKSTTCKALQELGYNAHDIESIDGLYELVEEATGRVLPGNLDQIGDGINWNCNKARLKQVISNEKEGLTFYCGGMANTEEVWDDFDLILVLTVSDETSITRLSTRQQGEFGSTSENRDWVLSWKHGVESGWLTAGGIAVRAESSPKEVAAQVVAASEAHQ